MQVPHRKAEERRANAPEDPYLTPEAIRRMQDDLDRLMNRVRPGAIEEVTRLAAMGDFSENAAYQLAKGRLRGLNDRILVLQGRLKRAIPIAAGASGTVTIGSTVTLETNGAERVYEIVGSQEADPSAGRISRTSPLGAALLGKRVGDAVTVKTPRGEVGYRIAAVS